MKISFRSRFESSKFQSDFRLVCEPINKQLFCFKFLKGEWQWTRGRLFFPSVFPLQAWHGSALPFRDSHLVTARFTIRSFVRGRRPLPEFPICRERPKCWPPHHKQHCARPAMLGLPLDVFEFLTVPTTNPITEDLPLDEAIHIGQQIKDHFTNYLLYVYYLCTYNICKVRVA